MPEIFDKQAYLNSSVVLWLLEHQFVNEVGVPFEFVKHRFLIDYLNDDHPHKATTKCSQVGWTTTELIDDFHLVMRRKLNVIHTMHNSDFLQSFVRPKVNPLIQNNPVIAKALTTSDSEGLKGFGNHFLYLKGANAQSQAISISADVLKIDEKDKSDPVTVEMFQSRLDYSQYRWVREFSNPTSVGFGIDASWQKSDQRHWFVKCNACNHNMYLDWEASDVGNHYVDQTKRIFACGKCGGEISTADRIRGEWVAKWPSRSGDIHGYWVSQLMAPWFSATDLVKKFENNSIEFFYNFVLGRAYTQADLRFDRQAILDATRPATPVLQHVVMGSDIGKPHWYWLATPNGFFKCGRAESWDELERIFLEYNCEAWVMDAQPEFTQVQAMLRKYPHRAYACYFIPDSKAVGAIRWQEGDKRGLVYADRTKAIDRFVMEMTTGQNHFLLRPQELEEMIKHAGNMYRVVETDDKGRTTVEWRTVTKPDHLMFAAVYARIALEKVFSGTGAGVVSTTPVSPGIKRGPTIQDGKATFTVDVERSLAKSRTIR